MDKQRRFANGGGGMADVEPLARATTGPTEDQLRQLRVEATSQAIMDLLAKNRCRLVPQIVIRNNQVTSVVLVESE